MKGFEALGLEREDIDRLHTRAEGVIEDYRVREEDCTDRHSDETIKRDKAHVADLERRFKSGEIKESAEQKKVADIFEAIIVEQGELSEWFGGNAMTIKTSKFDDYENGVDVVIEFGRDEEETPSYLGLAADVTFTTDTTKKFERLKAQIRSGKLGRVKYFDSKYVNGEEDPLSKLPEVIIGASKATVLELAELWAGGRKNNKLMARHRIQIMILHQIQEQLDTFARYALSVGRGEEAKIYRERLKIVDKLLADKVDIEREATSSMLQDPVHSEIMNFMARWRESIDAEMGQAA